MDFNRVRWSLIAACVLAFACGDDDDKDVPSARSPILNVAARQIAAAALADEPGADFRAARGRVEANVPPAGTAHARQVAIGAGSGAAIASDPMLIDFRRAAAVALGTTIDPVKAANPVSAQSNVDELLQEVVRIVPGATSCNALPEAKAQACAIAFLIIEVQRSEGVAAVADAGVPVVVDAGADAAVVTPVGQITCPATRDITGAREITGSISASDTWSGKVLIKSSVYVNASAKITIAAGTTVYMDTDSALYFGYDSSDVSIFSNGTATDPVRFCGKTAEKGFWNEIYFYDNITSDSYLRNTLFAEGGGSNDPSLQLNADITLDNVQVADSGKNGVGAKDFKVDSKNLSVRGSLGYPLVLQAPPALAHVPVGGTFEGNTTNQVLIDFSTFDIDLTVHNLGVPYLTSGSLYQYKGSVIVEAGVEWRFKSDQSIMFGYNEASSVKMNGTAAAPIKFTPENDISNWNLVRFYDKVASSSSLSYVQFIGGGKGGDAAVDIESPLLLDHVTLDKNVKGMAISTKGLAAGSNGIVITGTQAMPLTINEDGVFTLPADTKIMTNAVDQIELVGGYFNIDGTIPNVGVPYVINTSRYTADGCNQLTVAPGTQFVLGADVLLNLGYYDPTITLAGTAAAPIKFKGAQALPGFWKGLSFGSKTRTNSKIDFVEITEAGGTGSALSVDSSFPVTNTKITNPQGSCIDKGTSTIDYTLPASMNTLTCMTPIAP